MEMGGMDMEMEMGGMGRGSGADMEMDMDMDMDMGMDMMMGGMSGGRGGTTVEYKTQPAEVLATRKKLNYILQQVQLGMTGYPTAGIPPQNAGGLLVSAAPEQKLTVEKWVTALEGVITVLNDASLDDMDKFREGIEEQIVVLQDLVGGEIAGIPVDLPDELTPANPLAEIGGGVANPVAPAANPGVAGAVNVGGANGEASTGTVSIDEN